MNKSFFFQFQFSGSLRQFVQNGLENVSAVTNSEGLTNSNINRRRKNLRVTIQPSMLVPKAFKIKNERS